MEDFITELLAAFLEGLCLSDDSNPVLNIIKVIIIVLLVGLCIAAIIYCCCN